MSRANVVFKGGGVKGIALTGSLAVAEEQGWSWNCVAGTSAGAITAALVAAGYTAPEVHKIINDLNFKDFEDGRPIFDFISRNGLYKGEYVIQLMDRLLSGKLQKEVVTFRDLPVPLKVVATDITHKRILVFPDDLAGAPYHVADPLSFPVSHAVRASMSIPLFFEPYEIETSSGVKATLVDGGMLSNFPVSVFDPKGQPAVVPTFGFYLQAPTDVDAEPTETLKQFLHAIIDTVLSGHDNTDMANQEFERTLCIDTGVFGTTQFDIDQAGKDWLYQSGRKAANEFFASQAIQEWLRRFNL